MVHSAFGINICPESVLLRRAVHISAILASANRVRNSSISASTSNCRQSDPSSSTFRVSWPASISFLSFSCLCCYTPPVDVSVVKRPIGTTSSSPRARVQPCQCQCPIRVTTFECRFPLRFRMSDANPSPDRYAETIRRNELIGRKVTAPISFSATDFRAPKMDLVIQAYSFKDEKTRDGPNCAIPRECIPSWDDLAHWAGQQILEERKQPFQSAIESFIIAYSDRRGKDGRPLNNRELKLPKVCFASEIFPPSSLCPMGPVAGPGRGPNPRRLFLGCRTYSPRRETFGPTIGRCASCRTLADTNHPTVRPCRQSPEIHLHVQDLDDPALKPQQRHLLPRTQAQGRRRAPPVLGARGAPPHRQEGHGIAGTRHPQRARRLDDAERRRQIEREAAPVGLSVAADLRVSPAALE